MVTEEVKVRDLRTLEGLQTYLSNHPSVSLATTIATAINYVKQQRTATGQRELDSQAGLGFDLLEEIRQAIFTTGKPGPGVEPFQLLFAALTSKDGNPTEVALVFIEQLQRQLQS